jgi:hypothetical protein
MTSVVWQLNTSVSKEHSATFLRLNSRFLRNVGSHDLRPHRVITLKAKVKVKVSLSLI